MAGLFFLFPTVFHLLIFPDLGLKFPHSEMLLTKPCTLHLFTAKHPVFHHICGKPCGNGVKLDEMGLLGTLAPVENSFFPQNGNSPLEATFPFWR